MKTPLFSLIIAMTSGLTALAQSPAPAPTPPPLDQRVEKLEGDISQILQLLKDQQKQAPNPSNPASPNPTNSAAPTLQTTNSPADAAVAPAPAPKTANLKPGAILEIWTLKPDFQGDAPIGRSIGGMIDQGEYFTLTNFIEEPSLANQQSNRVALKWSGLYKAKEAGTYVFTVELSKANTHLMRETYAEYNWNVELMIDSQSLLKITPKFQSSSSFAFSDSAQVNMEAGYYPFTLQTFFTHPDGANATGWDYKQCKVTVKVRGPSDMLPTVISSQNLFHKE